MTHFKDIDSTLISLGEPEQKKAGSFHYTAVPILCGGKPLTMRATGRLKVYQHGKASFSIGLSVDDTNRKEFEDIESKIREETRSLDFVRRFARTPSAQAKPTEGPTARRRLGSRTLRSGQRPSDPGARMEDFSPKEFKLIRWGNYGFPKVYANLYTTTKGMIKARFYEKVLKDLEMKKKKIPDPRDLVGVPLDGEVVFQLQRVHIGSVRTITVVAKEVLIDKEIHAESYFDYLSDDEDEGEPKA